MYQVSDLVPPQKDSKSAALVEYVSWLVVADLDAVCNSCNTKLLLIVPSLATNTTGQSRFLCIGCRNSFDLSNLSLKQQHVLVDRLDLINDLGVDIVARSFFDLMQGIIGISRAGKINQSQNTASKKFGDHATATKSSSVDRHERDVVAPVPNGYRSVSWVRVHEARAIEACHEKRKDFSIKCKEGKIILECKFFSNNSDEVKRFKSNVQVIRVNGENRRVVGWIRKEEASALLAAHEEQRDIEFSHLGVGNGGLVQFFPAHSPAAKKYKSSTRLLRRD